MKDDNKGFLDIKNLYKNWFANLAAKKAKVKPKKNQGRLLWNSSERGTYIKKIHGELK